MKHFIQTAATAALLGISFVVVDSDAAIARGQTGTACSVTDITSALYGGPIACFGSFSGNDDGDDTANLFGNSFSGSITNVQANGKVEDNSPYKIDASSGSTSLFSIVNNSDGNAGMIEFLQDIDYQFSLVLKTSRYYSSYVFDGVVKDSVFSFKTDGVAENQNQNAAALSHSTLYLSDQVAVPPEPPVSTPTEIPEPSTAISLLAFGVAIKAARRRPMK